jgi:hypothetical protein
VGDINLKNDISIPSSPDSNDHNDVTNYEVENKHFESEENNNDLKENTDKNLHNNLKSP